MKILSMFAKSGKRQLRRNKSHSQKRRVLVESLERRYCFDGSAPTVFGEGTVTGPNIPGFTSGVNIDLAANDFDVDEDLDYNAIVLEILSEPAYGTLDLENVANYGAVNYLPYVGVGDNQTDQFTYRIQDLAGNWSESATATITVDPDPTASDVFVHSKTDTEFTIDVLSATSDVYWFVDPNSLEILQDPSLGTLDFLESGEVFYSFTGDPLQFNELVSDSFTYRMADENGDFSNIATVTIDMGNHAPVAVDDTARTRVNQSVFIGRFDLLSNDFDIDFGDSPVASTFSISTTPANGVLTLTESGDYVYQPNLGFSGTDSFTYIVADADSKYSEPATVRIFVLPPPAIIDNGLIQLGVNQEGHLNVSEGSTTSAFGTGPTGLRYVPTNYESTAPGCLCEGWGVADGDTNLAGYANVSTDQGARGMRFVSFDSTPYSAVSVVDVDGTTNMGGGGSEATSSLVSSSSILGVGSPQLIRVTHDYHPTALTPNLYEVTVTIQNLSSKPINDLRYRRVMDWDIEPTAFNEFVTIQGFGVQNPNLLFTSNNGFASANPLSGPGFISGEVRGNFTDSGPNDHGALFDFGNFGVLEPGGKTSFNIYYGAAENQANAMTAISAVNARVFSIAKSSEDVENGTPNTFIFAFGNLRTNVENNVPPVANNDQLNTKFNTPVNLHASALLANDNDPDGDTVSLRIESVDEESVNGGVITVNPQTFQISYAPPAGFRGIDSFTYRISDGLASDDAIVYVNVGAPTVTKVFALYGGAAGAPPVRSFEITPSTRVLPWEVKGVEVQFDSDVSGADILDINGASFSSASNSATNSLRWTFTTPIFVGALSLSLRSGPNGVFGADGLNLDGDGDGVGGEPEEDSFAFSFRVLEGDFDGNGVVENLDVTRVLLSRGTANLFADIDGDGDVDNNDVAKARSRLRNRLPS